MAISELLVNGSFLTFCEQASELGRYRMDNCRKCFLDRLTGLGMGEVEAVSYWDAIDRSMGSDTWVGDRKLAMDCGILLDAQKFPRNFLLYRLVQLLFPGVLKVGIRTIDQESTVLQSRWEYAGLNKKNVMVFTLPSSAPKKARTRIRKRSVRRYNEYYS